MTGRRKFADGLAKLLHADDGRGSARGPADDRRIAPGQRHGGNGQAHPPVLSPGPGKGAHAHMEIDRDAMLGELYNELRAAAARMLRRDAPALTLQPTELVNEAAIRIMRLNRMEWNDRQHFFATGARVMRQAMIDAVRSRRRAKRQAPTILFEDEGGGVDVEALDAALTKLEGHAPDLARIVELRYFVGLSLEEIAAVLESSPSTVKRRWKAARLWLLAELSDQG